MNGLDLGLLDKKNKGFKNLSLLAGFNLADPPVKINDNLRLNNSITLDNKDVIDEKIFIKFLEQQIIQKKEMLKLKRKKLEKINNSKKREKIKKILKKKNKKFINIFQKKIILILFINNG